jgi:stress-induced morphogen
MRCGRHMIDLAGDDNHWAATVSSAAFKGKSRVQQRQMVYAALKGNRPKNIDAEELTIIFQDFAKSFSRDTVAA